MARPHRLDRSCYVGQQQYFVTACTHNRVKAFADQPFATWARDALLATMDRTGFALTAYCLMPDHAHLLMKGLTDDADMSRALACWRQQTGVHAGRRLWQRGYWDRTLRADQDLPGIARYVVENPVRAGLVQRWADYPFVGSTYTAEEIVEAIQLPDTWSARHGGHGFSRPETAG